MFRTSSMFGMAACINIIVPEISSARQEAVLLMLILYFLLFDMLASLRLGMNIPSTTQSDRVFSLSTTVHRFSANSL